MFYQQKKMINYLIVILLLLVVNNSLHSQETAIMTAFNKHYTYFKAEITKRLTKDSAGYNDTYVLYDMQVYMQNAAIYADEFDDIEMLNKLLEYSLLPLKPEYMTDGKWLNNTHGYIGVEVDLCIAQYFILLTRVLSACERHGIDTALSDYNIQIITSHINQWLGNSVRRDRVDDRHLFFVQSILQFHDFLTKTNRPNYYYHYWQQYVNDYINLSITPKWEIIDYAEHPCWMLDRTGWVSYADYDYSGYGREITKTSSDTDPNSMFWADGTVKQPIKRLQKASTDLYHARRFNLFFETVKRFGSQFELSISNELLIGWANNLAYRVCQGTLEEPYFTVFSDGVDGWYGVNYGDRLNHGFAPGDMDIHFVTSSYGFFGIYNSRIYNWMQSWVEKNNDQITRDDDGYHGGYDLDYQTSLVIDINKPLKNISQISSTLTQYGINESFVIHFSNSLSSKDWIAIYKEGETAHEKIDWFYTNGTKQSTNVLAFGNVTFYTNLSPGNYSLALLENDSYNTIATGTLTITDTPIVSTTQNNYHVGETIMAHFSNSSSSKDWIAIYKEGETAHEKIDWFYINGTKQSTNILAFGDVQFSNHLLPGNYKVALLENDSYNILASKSFIISDISTVSSSFTIYGTSENIIFKFSNQSESNRDWIAIYKDTDSVHEKIDWLYTNGTQTPADILNFGSVTFDNNLPPGNYRVAFLENDSYTIIANNAFSVTDSPIISINKNNYIINEAITIHFANSLSSKDWIAIYKEGETAHEKIAWYYVDGTTGGNVNMNFGNVTFIEDLPAGNYQVSMFENDTYTVLATQSFKVKE